MTLNGPMNSIDSDREAVAPGDTVRRIPEEYRPSIDEFILSAREDVARLAQFLLVQGTCQSGLAPRILRRVEEHIDAHLDSALNIAELAANVGISVSHFSRSFFRSVGLTPHRYVMRRRLTRAHDLLAQTDLAVAEVALATGFADQSHFCRRFREFTGLPPRSFRMQHR